MNYILETERLILRKFNENDLDDYYEYVKSEDIGFLCGWYAAEIKKD